MYKILTSLAILVVSLNTLAANIAQDPYCYEEDKVFKRCEDQKALFEAAKAAAASQDKLVMAVYGFEACPYSQAMIKSLNFSSFASQLKSKYVIVPISYSKVYQSGRILMSELRAQFNQPEFGQFGLPQLLLINPKSGKGSFINTREFERNTTETEAVPAYRGFHVEKLVKKINEVEGTL